MQGMNPYTWFPAPYRRPAAVITVIVIAVVLLIVLDKPLNLGLFRWLKSKGGDKVPVNDSDGPTRNGFNPVNEASAIKAMLDKWDLPWDGDQNLAAFKKILGYSDAELKKVHNAWLEKYKGTANDTLRKQITAESTVRDQARKLKDQVIARLDKLNL